MSLNFRIVDGSEEEDALYNEFSRLREDTNRTIRSIAEELGVNEAKGYRLNKRYKDEHDLRNYITRRGRKPKNYHYSTNTGLYHVVKNFRKKAHYYCAVRTEDEAKAVVKYLWRIKWDVKKWEHNKDRVLARISRGEY